MKLKFNADAWYGNDLIAKAGEIVEVSEENGFAARWVKRGAEIVQEGSTSKVAQPVKEIAQPAEEIEVHADPENKEHVANEEVKVQNKKVKSHKGK